MCALVAAACGGDASPGWTRPDERVPYDGETLAAVRGSPVSFLFAPSHGTESDPELEKTCKESFDQLRSARLRLDASVGIAEPDQVAEGYHAQVEELNAELVDDWTAAGTPERHARANAKLRVAEQLELIHDRERFEHEAEFQSPDRWYIRSSWQPLMIDFASEPADQQEIIIGDRSWLEKNGTWEEQDEDSAMTDGEFAQFCTAISEYVAAAGTTSSEETINGRNTIRYVIDNEAFNRLEAADGVEYAAASIGLWIDKASSLPIQIQFEGMIDFEEAFGGLGEGADKVLLSIECSYELYDLNDPSIQIEPPLVEPQSTPEQ